MAENGCSLEDCYTNLFALTDLAGIRWCKLHVRHQVGFLNDPLEDPILTWFSKCIQADMLCAWRRQQCTTGHPVEQLAGPKELWVFWYGDEPSQLQSMLDSGVFESDKGSWDNQLSYECRTLLFKALHNLIERCLLSQNYVRVGKWFVQPHQESVEHPSRSAHLSMSFLFFLHGESTVCASVDVRQHPPLHCLRPAHLNMISRLSRDGMNVLLAPYGMMGLLTGRTYSDADVRTQRLMEEWRQYFCLPAFTEAVSEDGTSHMPSFVEVIVGGVRLRYPSSFVLLTGDDEVNLTQAYNNVFSQSAVGAGAQPEPDAPPRSVKPPPSGTAEPVRVENPVKLDCRFGDKTLSSRLVEKAWQDGSVTTGMFIHGSRHIVMEVDGSRDDAPSNSSSSTAWEFGEPMHKNACFCAKNKSLKVRPTSSIVNKQNPLQTSGIGTKHIGKTPNDRPDKLSRHSRSFAPYHRRPACVRDPIPIPAPPDPRNPTAVADNARNPMDMPSVRTLKPSGMAAAGTLASHANAATSADSPHSAAPSPLTATPTQQPPVNPVADPTMPTLSPHPPPKHGVGGGGDRDSRDTLSGLLLAPSDSGCGANGSDVANTSAPNVRQPSLAAAAADVDVAAASYKDRIVMFSERCEQVLPQLRFPRADPKRPVLAPMFEGDDDEELATASFYDSSLESTTNRTIHRLSSELSPSFPVSPPLSIGSMSSAIRSGPASDPYRFEDEMDSGLISPGGPLKMRDMRSSALGEAFLKPATFSTSGRSDDPGRRDSTCNGVADYPSMDLSPSPIAKSAQSTTALMHEYDLKPNIQDLDNLFDTDGEAESDSPPSAMQHDRHGEDGGGVTRSTTTSFGIPGVNNTGLQGDLSRMFPTPPSAEAACSIASPMQTSETLTAEMVTIDGLHHLHHLHHHAVVGSLTIVREEPSVIACAIVALKKECPFVSVVPPVCQFPASKMYDPVELPSCRLPPLAVADRIYRPSARNNVVTSQQQQQQQQQQQHVERQLHMTPLPSQYNMPPYVDNPMSNQRFRRADSVVSIDASPGMQQHMMSQQQRTPMSYELMSPASSSGASSSFYAGRNIGSVDPPCHQTPGAPLPEAGALFVGLALSDSSLGIFRDENFDSCTICVCNMSIEGPDVGTVLPPRRGSLSTDDQTPCSCAFSAVMNRRRAYLSGLFFEDEIDITGVPNSAYDVRKPPLAAIGPPTPGTGWGDPRGVAGAEALSDDVLQLLRVQMSSLYPSCAVSQVCCLPHVSSPPPENIFTMEMIDGRSACMAALNFVRQIEGVVSVPVGREPYGGVGVLHSWPLQKYTAKLATNSTDVVQLLKSLKPLLQDAIQKKRSTRLWESVYTISGPLTWKDFHLMAGRGSEETSEPKPVPALLVGYEQDWLSVAPQSVLHWDVLLLEPYHQPHDVLYVVVAPENDFLLGQCSTFFQQLSVTYEQCRLGRHRPISDKLRDGVMRVGRSNAQKVADEPLDDWFRNIGNSAIAAKLRLYAQVCRKLLAPFLTHCLAERKKISEELSKPTSSNNQYYRQVQSASNSGDPPGDSLLNSTGTTASTMPGSTASSMNSSSADHPTPFDNDRVTPDCIDGSVGNSQSKDSLGLDGEKDHSESGGSGDSSSGLSEGPYLVVYMVDSFTYGLQEAEIDDPNAHRLAMIGLLQCYVSMMKAVPEHLHSAIQLQIVPQQTLTNFGPFGRSAKFLKNLSFSVYANCRQSLARAPTLSRSLTGFGPSSNAEKVYQSAGGASVDPGSLYTPPFVLAPPRELLPVTLLDPVDRSNVLLCAYCLSADQRWLLASCTDARGELLDSTCINVDVPMRSRRRNYTVRRVALNRLWDFLLGVMAQTTTPWRVVIGRFGRLGHGELKGWAYLLSRRSLRACKDRLHTMCATCGPLGETAVPCIISACVISTELHPSIHIMLDAVKPDDNQRSRRPLSTPADVSCTHILVFPTSATAQANTGQNPQDHVDHDAFTILDGNIDNIDDTDLGDIGDLFGICGSPPKMGGGGSPVHHSDADRLGLGSGRDQTTAELLGADAEDLSNHSLLQQPLAVGFYVSTAPTGPLPAWFWSACPQRENLCPICFRAALHIHCPFAHQKEELINNSAHAGRVHPLDSNLTCDVLRYVLETYNTLSWLTVDPATGDRRSCLPAHILVLMQLCRGFETFI